MRPAIPETVRPWIETDRRLFSSFRKNDYGQGGAWPHFWGAFYPKEGSRAHDSQLFVYVNAEGLGFGFACMSPERRTRLAGVFLCSPVEQEAIAASLASENLQLKGSKAAMNSATLRSAFREGEEQAGIERFLTPAAVGNATRAAMADEVRRVMAAVLPVFLLSIGQRTAAVELVTEAASAERQPSYPIELFADETGMGSQHIRGWMRVLARKKQMILQGPPGTGKTFLARKLARHLVQNTEGFIETVQFHPAYGYEDFLQNL